MPLFPLDAVRNAQLTQNLEVLLEEVRASVARYPFTVERDGGTVEDILAAYDIARARLNVVAGLARRAEGRAADVSVGLGFLAVVLQRLGLEVTATEADLTAGGFAASQGIPVVQYHIGRERPPLEPGSFDVVIFSEVLEHLKLHPTQVISELATLLRPGGRLLLTTPNIARLAHIEALAAGESILEPLPDAIPPGADPSDYLEHVREYSIREAVEAVEAAGLAVEQVLMTGWGNAGYHPLPNPYANEIMAIDAVK